MYGAPRQNTYIVPPSFDLVFKIEARCLPHLHRLISVENYLKQVREEASVNRKSFQLCLGSFSLIDHKRCSEERRDVRGHVGPANVRLSGRSCNSKQVDTSHTTALWLETTGKPLTTQQNRDNQWPTVLVHLGLTQLA